jgi:hypothetical protein
MSRQNEKENIWAEITKCKQYKKKKVIGIQSLQFSLQLPPL